VLVKECVTFVVFLTTITKGVENLKNIIVFLSLMLLVACNDETKSENSEVITISEASWAYEFVRVDNQSYQLTNEEVDKEIVGEFIGEVKRNIVDADTNPYLNEENFDSNSLSTGTNLYKNSDDKESIIYEINEQYFKAKVPRQ
jgi:hypothetical protein